MLKKFVPIKYIILNICIGMILPLLIIGIIGGVFGFTYATSPICICLLLVVVVLCPILLYQNKDNACIIISSTTIENPITDRSKNSGWIEEIINIRSVKITTKEECQKYYKNCCSKRVLLIDFGNGNIKYLALDWFSKKQSEKILHVIEEQRQNLQN